MKSHKITFTDHGRELTDKDLLEIHSLKNDARDYLIALLKEMKCENIEAEITGDKLILKCPKDKEVQINAALSKLGLSGEVKPDDKNIVHEFSMEKILGLYKNDVVRSIYPIMANYIKHFPKELLLGIKGSEAVYFVLDRVYLLPGLKGAIPQGKLDDLKNLVVTEMSSEKPRINRRSNDNNYEFSGNHIRLRIKTVADLARFRLSDMYNSFTEAGPKSEAKLHSSLVNFFSENTEVKEQGISRIIAGYGAEDLQQLFIDAIGDCNFYYNDFGFAISFSAEKLNVLAKILSGEMTDHKPEQPKSAGPG